jgi:hypothetical protein
VTVKIAIPGASNEVLQSALSGVSEEAYTNAKKLSGTGLVGTNPDIDPSTETFIGQVRWHKPLNPVINVASLTDSTDGSKTSYTSDHMRYVKSVRTHGAEKVNMQKIVTGVDALAKIGRDFGETRAQDEHNAILAVIKGVAIAEALNGAATGSGATGLGGQTFDNDPADKKYGFYVDLGAAKPVIDASGSHQGAARAQGFLNAFGMAFKDYEPEYAYLATSPEMMASFRSANLVDQDRITDGDIEFQTLFNGKFRLISTRANQSMSSAQLTKINTGAGVDIVGTKTSFIILPGALAMAQLDVPDQTEITRRGAAYKGGGVTDIWYRWGYVFAPKGYDWIGSEEVFASDTSYTSVVEGASSSDGANVKALTAVTTMADAKGTWNRKTASALSLGILPVFHS